MASKTDPTHLDSEIAALNAVVNAIQALDAPAQERVVGYVIRRFDLQAKISGAESEFPTTEYERETNRESEPKETIAIHGAQDVDGLEGINPVAKKWMSRNGLSSTGVSTLFSLGIDEIDLVAKKVPGKTKKDRMRSVILLKGVASYLGTGAARVTHEQVKETCLHYDAFDTNNFAGYLKSMAAEVSGTKESGYSLTARGLTAATEMIQAILKPSGK